jgi:type IV secretory pathway VirB10-like protein
MPFSLGSYLLGVGTVVGALAFGFSGGVLLTKTAMKDTTAVPTRVERVARSEPEPVASTQQQDVRENPVPPAEPASAAIPDPAPAGQVANVAATLQPDTPRDTASPKQPEAAKQAEPANSPEQKDAVQKRSADRKVERQKHSAERKARSFAVARTRQPPSEEQDQPERTGSERTEFVFSREEPGFFGREEPRFVTREEPHFGPFRMFGRPPFDRSIDRAPADRDDD